MDGLVAIQLAPIAEQQPAAGDAPRLRLIVAQVFDLEADLLHHLAVNGLLGGLAELGKARDERRARRAGAVRVLREQQVVAVRHRHDDRGVDAREDHIAAPGAVHHALVDVVLERRAAAAAEPRVAVPAAQVPRADRGEGDLLRLLGAENIDVAVGPAVRLARRFVAQEVVFPAVQLKKIGEPLVAVGKHGAARELESVVVDAAEEVSPAELHDGARPFRHGVRLPFVV